MFDEQPDGDPHGECAAEIARLTAENKRLARECSDWWTALGAETSKQLRVARMIEDMKQECGMDPESPTAIRNGRLMSIAAILRGHATPAAVPVQQATFQQRVQPWMMVCFGPEISADAIERNHRFLEEALELVQACGCTTSEAHQLVDYVYGRPVGDKHQEVGGVLVTLAALCLAQGLDMHEAGEVELARIWTKVEKIRAKQAAKPAHSPLPEAAAVQQGREAPCICKFDQWYENPYTKVVLKSIAEDYVPRADIAALASPPASQPLPPAGSHTVDGLMRMVADYGQFRWSEGVADGSYVNSSKQYREEAADKSVEIRTYAEALAATPAGSTAEPVELLPMETAPTDGTMVRLLVNYTDGENALEDATVAQTIGANNDGNVGPGEGAGWQFAGWCWTHDHFTEGRGKPIWRLPFHATGQKTAPCKTCGGYGYARGGVCWSCDGSGRAATTPPLSAAPVQQVSLSALNELAKVYASSYASPHHFTLGVEGLRNLIAEVKSAAGEQEVPRG